MTVNGSLGGAVLSGSPSYGDIQINITKETGDSIRFYADSNDFYLKKIVNGVEEIPWHVALKSDLLNFQPYIKHLTSDTGTTMSVKAPGRNTILFIGNQNGSQESFLGLIRKSGNTARIDKVAGGIDAPIMTCENDVLTFSGLGSYYVALLIGASYME